MKIIVIEDDADIRDLLTATFKIQGYQVRAFGDGAEAFAFLSSQTDPDICQLFIVDRMLPGKSGKEICEFIRKSEVFFSHPIIVLTAMSEKNNIIEGLGFGADDYITKPFDIDELVARVKSQLRRSQNLSISTSSVNKIIEYQGLRIFPDEFRVELDENEIHLTKTEFSLLFELLNNLGKVQSRADLINKIQGNNTFVTERTVDTHMTSLRKKIGEYSRNIETIRGVGYKFVG